jgi:GNAT superfamily N-acetyltransferase
MATRIVALESIHDVGAFDCGTLELNFFLQTTAGQHQRKLISKTYVLIDDAAPTQVLGFYTLAVRRMVLKEALPPALAKRLPREVPGFTLARLAGAQAAQGLGHGEYLLLHAMQRAARVASEIGGYALFVDAKNGDVAAFYQRYGVAALPDDSLTLCLPFADMPDF